MHQSTFLLRYPRNRSHTITLSTIFSPTTLSIIIRKSNFSYNFLETDFLPNFRLHFHAWNCISSAWFSQRSDSIAHTIRRRFPGCKTWLGIHCWNLLSITKSHMSTQSIHPVFSDSFTSLHYENTLFFFNYSYTFSNVIEYDKHISKSLQNITQREIMFQIFFSQATSESARWTLLVYNEIRYEMKSSVCSVTRWAANRGGTDKIWPITKSRIGCTNSARSFEKCPHEYCTAL